ncbi:MAG: MaoC/PaaZ C-terminal domain-containing protein [Chloroflexi bacterium]|nr:MaoC/PaaZ C-terminal domain-containing protein [Chloroflexota bacterium]MDA1145667.1 MaoC/PaaZ C-terminal domain-containing protein [Chloroflexota bacterium]
MTTARRIEHQLEAYLSNEDSADISNPIHSSEVAAKFGFRGALIGGVTVWGWATPAILEALGDGWLSRGWSEFGFRQPTYPGDQLTIVAEPVDDDSGAWSITMTNQDGVQCVWGTVGLGDADWLDEYTTPQQMTDAPAPDPRPALVLESAPVGQDWLAKSIDATPELAREFAADKQHSDDARFVGDQPLLHPAWTAGWAENLLRHNTYVPSSMHTRSRIQHLAPIHSGQVVTGGAHFLEAYERNAHHFANYDVLLRGADGTDLARLRHWTVFRIATPEERAAAGG